MGQDVDESQYKTNGGLLSGNGSMEWPFFLVLTWFAILETAADLQTKAE